MGSFISAIISAIGVPRDVFLQTSVATDTTCGGLKAEFPNRPYAHQVTYTSTQAAPRLKPLGWLLESDRWTFGELAATGHAAISLAAIETLGLYRIKDPPRVLPRPPAYRHLIPSTLDMWCLDFHWTIDVTGSNFDVIGSTCPPEISRSAPLHSMTRTQIQVWLRTELNRLAISEKHLEGIFFQPAQLVLKGYCLIRWARRKFVECSQLLLLGLVMIGLGSRWLYTQRRCEVCFRCAEPGLSRCRYHSQSKLNLDTSAQARATASQSARVARRVLQLPDMGMIPAVRASSGIYCVAGILWPARADAAVGSRAKLADAIAEAPLLANLLPADFLTLPYRQQFAHLRTQIDPNEWSPFFWDRRLRDAERWMKMEAAAAPGWSGPSKLNQKRLARAQELLAVGLSRSEAADVLAITRSHLTKLLGRHGLRVTK